MLFVIKHWILLSPVFIGEDHRNLQTSFCDEAAASGKDFAEHKFYVTIRKLCFWGPERRGVASIMFVLEEKNHRQYWWRLHVRLVVGNGFAYNSYVANRRCRLFKDIQVKKATGESVVSCDHE